MGLVVHFGAVGHHFTQLVVAEVWVEAVFDHAHEFELADGTHHAQVQEHVVRVLDEIGAVQEGLEDVDDTDSDEFAIDPMIHVISAEAGWTDALVFELTKSFVYFSSRV